MKNPVKNLVLVFGISACSLAAATPAAHAQYKDNLGNGYNNSTSALLGTMINRNAMSRSISPIGGAGGGGRSAIERAANAQEARGRLLIKQGKATTHVTMRPFPIDKWMQTDWNGDAETRRKNYGEYLSQKQLWADELKARGAKGDDIGDVYALAMATCFEAYTGKRLSDAGFQKLAHEYHKAWRNAPYYQAGALTDKQKRMEETMLLGSYPLYLSRKGDTEKAKSESKRFMDKWWDGGTVRALQELSGYTHDNG